MLRNEPMLKHAKENNKPDWYSVGAALDNLYVTLPAEYNCYLSAISKASCLCYAVNDVEIAAEKVFRTVENI